MADWLQEEPFVHYPLTSSLLCCVNRYRAELTRSGAVELITAVFTVYDSVTHRRLGQTYFVRAHVVTFTCWEGKRLWADTWMHAYRKIRYYTIINTLQAVYMRRTWIKTGEIANSDKEPTGLRLGKAPRWKRAILPQFVSSLLSPQACRLHWLPCGLHCPLPQYTSPGLHIAAEGPRCEWGNVQGHKNHTRHMYK